MASQMSIDGELVPIGDVQLHFQYFLDDGPPHAWLDIHSSSDDYSLAGVAINCLDVGDLPTIDMLSGATLHFGGGQECEHAELRESVFWRPGDKTLEVLELRLQFGELAADVLPIEIVATCFDHTKQGINVLLRVQAKINKK